MYIRSIKLTNFKSFAGKHTIEFSKNLNVFVGDNNCGKTTVFKAVEFIQSGKNKEDYITIGKEDEDVSVEIEFCGNDLKSIIESEELNLKKYKNYIIESGSKSEEDDERYALRILRSSVETKVTGKKNSLTLKNVRVYNPNSAETDEIKKFENPAGIDSTIMALFDAQFVYSDLKNEDYRDFGKTKVVGKLINDITRDFQQGNAWKELKVAHTKAFGDEGITRVLEEIQGKVSTILQEQYGEGEVKFNFGLPEIENFFKTGSILLTDGGIETDVSEKGTGMQRALALSLIQVYAEISNRVNEGVSKPILFFIDEPETFLHPKAQNKLMRALDNISERQQVFITTHSPYLLKHFDSKKHKLKLFSKDSNSKTSKAEDGNMLDLFGSCSPSWGEINYFAFDVVSEEFHNELYGFLQARAIKEDLDNSQESKFDNWLANNGIAQDKQYIRLKNDGTTVKKNKTLPGYIRNIVHHPENTHNHKYTSDELRRSIKAMVSLLQNP